MGPPVGQGIADAGVLRYSEGMTVATKLTVKKRNAFLKALATCGNVSASCITVGTTRDAVYKLKKRDEKFAEAWEDAIQQGADELEEEARRRAMGWDEDRYTKEGAVYLVNRHSDLLMIFLLKGLRPEKYKDRVSHDAEVRTDNRVVYYPDNGRGDE
jgi:hypothetical protein